MGGTRPCRVCGKWFRAEPRQGDRQRTCGREECKKEWHRRGCAKWHKNNPGYDTHTRLLKRLVRESPPVLPGGQADPLRVINWPLAREEIGLKVSVLIEESVKAVIYWARDA